MVIDKLQEERAMLEVQFFTGRVHIIHVSTKASMRFLMRGGEGRKTFYLYYCVTI